MVSSKILCFKEKKKEKKKEEGNIFFVIDKALS